MEKVLLLDLVEHEQRLDVGVRKRERADDIAAELLGGGLVRHVPRTLGRHQRGEFANAVVEVVEVTARRTKRAHALRHTVEVVAPRV